MIGIFEEGTSLFDIGAITTITGLVLVFAMLLFLVFVLYIFGWVSSFIKKSSEKKANKAKEELLKHFSDSDDNVANEEVLNDSALSKPTSDGINEEIIAAISAAVSVMYAGSGKKPVIKAVKKSGTRRSAWASAGVANNTRNF